MNISILGTASVGQALAQKLGELGHNIFMGTRNVENSLKNTGKDDWGLPKVGAWIKDHPDVKLVTFKESVEQGSDLIVFAMNGASAFKCLEMVGPELLSNKIMIDISNPLDFSEGFPPSLFVNNKDSLGEQIQRAYPDLKVVKTLNTMSNPVMINPSILKGDHTVFVCGNDEAAKQNVIEMLKSFGWEDKNIIDLGDITMARGTEMILPLWVRLYGKFETPLFNFNVNTNQA